MRGDWGAEVASARGEEDGGGGGSEREPGARWQVRRASVGGGVLGSCVPEKGGQYAFWAFFSELIMGQSCYKAHASGPYRSN